MLWLGSLAKSFKWDFLIPFFSDSFISTPSPHVLSAFDLLFLCLNSRPTSLSYCEFQSSFLLLWNRNLVEEREGLGSASASSQEEKEKPACGRFLASVCTLLVWVGSGEDQIRPESRRCHSGGGLPYCFWETQAQRPGGGSGEASEMGGGVSVCTNVAFLYLKKRQKLSVLSHNQFPEIIYFSTLPVKYPISFCF